MRIFIDIGDFEGGSNFIPLKVQGLTLDDQYEAIGAIVVSWTKIEGYDIVNYEIWRKDGSGPWNKITEKSQEDYGSFIEDANIENEIIYTYRVRAEDVFGMFTNWSEEKNIQIEDIEIPEPPSNIVSIFGYTWADLTWDAVIGVDGYNVYRNGVLAGFTEENNFSDHDLENGTLYTYTVKSVQGILESEASEEAEVTTDTPAVTGARYATEQDALRIKNANVGDVILDRHNGTQPDRYSIEHNQHVGTQFELGAGQKILIKGGTYEHLWLDLPDAIGTKENPIIITNYEGQVKFKFDHTTTSVKKDRMIFDGIQNFKVTGKYDPTAKTGDPRFVGHDSGYDFLHDTYGFIADNDWSEDSDGLGCISGNQTYFEIEYIECRNGGFAAFKIKKDSPADPDIPMDINIHDNFIHDTGGEAFYVGNNNSSNCLQHGIKGRIWNNLIVRTGTEGLQIGNIIGLFAAYNNTLISTNTSWMSPFQNFHFKGNQLETKEGKFDYIGNFVYGSGMVNLDIRSFDVPCFSPSISKPIRIGKNTFAFANERNMYIFNSTDSITPLLIEENIFHNGINRAGKVYRDGSELRNDVINNNRSNVFIRNNEYTSGRTFLTGGSPEENTNNTPVSYTTPVFENSGYHSDFNPLDITIWTSKIGERSGFTTPVITWKTGAFESLGTIDLNNITENQVIEIDEFDKTNTEADYWDSLIGIDIRLADVDNEYSNFVIVNLKAVDLVAKTITVSAPSKTQGVLGNVKLIIDKHLAYRTFNYDGTNPELSEIVLINSKQYQYKWQGDSLLACGVNPETDVANGDGTEGTYWKLLTWQKPDGTVSHYPPDNWKITEGTYYENKGVGYEDYEFIPDPPITLEREYDFTYISELQNNWTGGAYVYIPQEYRDNPVANFPVIVAAHGQNERSGFGTTEPDFEKLSGDSSFTQYLRGTANEVPCIIICPQVIGNVSTFDPLLFDEAIEKVCSELITTLSPEKIIVSGWSSGGRGAWQYGEQDPKGRLVGLLPFATRLGIPANNTARDAYFNKNVPTWIFHNNDDATQEVANHIALFDYAKAQNADHIKASIFDASGHAIVIKVISGAGDDIVEGNGYTPYKNAGNALWNWIADSYYAAVE